MKFKQTLIAGQLIKRYKRFLADVELADGTQLTVHCPNSGSMKGCSEPGSAVYLSCSDNPKRKYPHTLELVRVGTTWVGINTALTNHLVKEALEDGAIKEFSSIESLKAEVKVSEKSRLDFCLRNNGETVYLEVKNCSMAQDRAAMFPDAVTVRGTKHLHELARLHEQGYGAAVLFCVQREDVDFFVPARHIDPTYAETLCEVAAKGVQVLAYRAMIDPKEIKVVAPLPVMLED